MNVGFNNMIMIFRKNVPPKSSQLKNYVWVEAEIIRRKKWDRYFNWLQYIYMDNSTLGKGRRDKLLAGQYKVRIGKPTNLLTYLS